MKKFILIIFCVSINLISKSQTFFEVKHKSQADILVYETKCKSQADLLVYKTKYQSNAKDKQGVWKFVQNQSQADFKIFFVEYVSQANLIIYYTCYKNSAGWQNINKKSILKK